MVMSDEEIENAVARLISKHSGLIIHEVTPDLRLAEDIKINGDDAYDLMMDYFKTFQVDMTGFEFSDYFFGEGADPLGVFTLLHSKEVSEKKTITVQLLQRNAVTKKWDSTT
jgi:acyl carrier protein